MPRILFSVVALLFAASVAAQAYRWVDKDGKVNYSQSAPSPGEAANVQKKSASGSSSESTQLPYATQLAAKNHPVTVYTAESCKEPCHEARTLLSQRGVPFREVAVGDEKTRAELKQVSGGDEVPVLAVGNQVTRGYLAESWHMALDSAGYPRSGPPLAAKAQKPSSTPPAGADASQHAAAAPAPQQPAGRYAPPPPDSKEAKQAAEQAARTVGRYAPPAASADASAPAASTHGPYAPK